MPFSGSQLPQPKVVQVEALTSIRFFAALSVLIAHFSQSFGNNLHPVALRFFEAGGSAVMFFFVLSGFIMTHVYRERELHTKPSRVKYFVARFARIAPLYYIALFLGLANIVMGAEKGSHSLWIWILSILSKFTFTQALIPAVVKDPLWAQVTWTLSVEFCFYLIFPFVLWPFLKANRKWLILLGILSIIYSAAAPQIAQTLTQASMGNRVYYLNALMYPGFFAIGMIARRIEDSYAERLRSLWLVSLVSGATLICFARAIELPISIDHSAHLVGSALAILGLFHAGGAVAAFLRQPLLILLGEASYALYLLHGPVGAFLSRFGIMPKESSVHFIIFAIISILVSIASYKLIEIPARNFITSRVKAIVRPPKGSASTN